MVTLPFFKHQWIQRLCYDCLLSMLVYLGKKTSETVPVLQSGYLWCMGFPQNLDLPSSSILLVFHHDIKCCGLRLFVLFICVGASVLPLSMIFLLEFRTVPTVWYFFFFNVLLFYFLRIFHSFCRGQVRLLLYSCNDSWRIWRYFVLAPSDFLSCLLLSYYTFFITYNDIVKR